MIKFPLTQEQINQGRLEDGFEDIVADNFDALYDYYLNTGEMPYGVAKARTGDPDQWILEKVEEQYGNG